MDRVEVADARNQFDEMIERASQGERIDIVDQGRPIVRMGPAERPHKSIDVQALRALSATMPVQTETAADLIRRMRDEKY